MKACLILATSAFALLLCTSCVHESHAAADSTQEVADTAAKNSRLLFFPASQSYNELTSRSGRLPRLDAAGNSTGATLIDDPAIGYLATQDKENKIYTSCGGLPPQGAEAIPIVAALAGWAITEASSWLVGTLDKELQNEVEKYVSAPTAMSGNFDFYDVLSDTKGFYAYPENSVEVADPPQGRQRRSLANAPKKPLHHPVTLSAHSCFRATLLGPSDPANQKSDPTILVDFVGSISYDAHTPEIVTLRPVRLYYKRIDTPKTDGQLGVNINLTADTITTGQVGGVAQKAAINASLVTVVIKTADITSTKPYYKIFDDKNSKPVDVPLPSWNFNPDQYAAKHNLMKASVTFKQTGNIPWLTKFLADQLDKNKDAAAKEIAAEADKGAGLDTGK